MLTVTAAGVSRSAESGRGDPMDGQLDRAEGSARLRERPEGPVDKQSNNAENTAVQYSTGLPDKPGCQPRRVRDKNHYGHLRTA
jgi:hypothetical protein